MAEMSKRWNIILNVPKGYTFDIEVIEKTFKILYPFYALILHDSDLNDYDLPKTDHIHAVVIRGSRCRFTTIINELSKMLELPKNCISVDETLSFCKSIRYLIHLDDKAKAPYTPQEIYTNRPNDVFNALNTLHDYVDYDLLYNTCVRCGCKRLYVMKFLGIDVYQRYSKVIDAIINELTLCNFDRDKVRKVAK